MGGVFWGMGFGFFWFGGRCEDLRLERHGLNAVGSHPAHLVEERSGEGHGFPRFYRLVPEQTGPWCAQNILG